MSRILLIFIGACQSTALLYSCSAVAADLLDEIQGYYSLPSRYCTEFNGTKIVSCEKKFKDCLVIKKKNGQFAEIEIFSTQANMHVCGVKGTAILKNGSLVYFDQDAEEEGQGLRISVTEKHLVLKYLKPNPQQVSFCGAHADIDDLKFERITKKKIARQCFIE